MVKHREGCEVFRIIIELRHRELFFFGGFVIALSLWGWICSYLFHYCSGSLQLLQRSLATVSMWRVLALLFGRPFRIILGWSPLLLQEFLLLFLLLFLILTRYLLLIIRCEFCFAFQFVVVLIKHLFKELLLDKRWIVLIQLFLFLKYFNQSLIQLLFRLLLPEYAVFQLIHLTFGNYTCHLLLWGFHLLNRICLEVIKYNDCSFHPSVYLALVGEITHFQESNFETVFDLKHRRLHLDAIEGQHMVSAMVIIQRHFVLFRYIFRYFPFNDGPFLYFQYLGVELIVPNENLVSGLFLSLPCPCNGPTYRPFIRFNLPALFFLACFLVHKVLLKQLLAYVTGVNGWP